ncbi:PAS domain S-box protein [Oxynema sp. CENA135]|uniref:PAS domain S-box protein n=1 Tax=Oxynema sp. CENA135 TaxID=984206 RepID=UPI00190CC554|nr:PAS domain S-box protein [Oxynema sp. CENA135]MBK4728294.1 PAS domain S-box protein [Oxynema sp. CENA135]
MTDIANANQNRNPTANILVIDDTPNNLRLLGKSLKQLGYGVRLAKDPQLALQSAIARPPDLILLDIMMPELDGYEVCAQLKANERTRQIPVIFLTAKGEVLDKVRAFELGAADYITKPFAMEEAIARIENQLKFSQLSQKLIRQKDLLQQEIQALQNFRSPSPPDLTLPSSSPSLIPVPLGENADAIETVVPDLVVDPPLPDSSALQESLFQHSQAIEKQCLRLSPGTTVAEAIARMSREGFSCALVVENNQLVGLFAERDIVKMAAEAIAPDDILLSEVMTPDPIAVNICEPIDIFSILSILRQHRIRHLPAIDESGRIVGLITQSSIRQVLQPTDLLKFKQVDRAMTRKVIHCAPSASVLEIARLMATYRISCVVIAEPTTGSVGDVIPIGIVTERDIVQFRALNLDLNAIAAREVMSAPLLPIEAGDSLWTAHQLMQRHRIRRLVVTSDNGTLAGILTQSSLLEALDPVEMQATLEVLRQQIDRRVGQLNEVNHRLQQEISARERELRERTILEQELKTQNLRLQAEIQERIRAENALAKQEELFRTVAENAPAAIMRLDRQYRYLYVNRMTEDIAGMGANEFIGKTSSELGFDESCVGQWETTIAEVFDRRTAQTIEYELPGSHGIRYFSARIVPEFDSRGEVASVLAIAHDIGDRKRREQALRSIVEGTASTTGDNFFYECTRYLAQVLQIRHALIAEQADPEFTKARTLAWWTGESHRENIEYELAGTPCRQVFRGESCFYPDSVRDRFPDDPYFPQLKIESYFGIPLNDSKGRAIGILTIFDERPMANDADTQTILKIFAARASAELERRQAEKILQQQAAAIAATADGIAILDPQNRYTYLNEAHLQIFGYEGPEELLGKSWQQLYPSRELERFEREIIPQLREKGSVRLDAIGLRRDGREVPHEVSVSLLDSGDRICIVRDCTERQQAQTALQESEQRLQVVLEGSDLGWWDLNLATGVVDFSERWKTMLGYRDEEIENVPNAWLELLHPDDLEPTLGLLNACLEGRSPSYEAEFRMLTRSGEWKWILAHGKIVERDERGQALRMAGTHKDIDDRKQAEVERLKLLAREQAARSEAEANRTRVETILESISDAFFALNRQWQITYMNQQAEVLLQQSRSELLGENLWEHFPEAVGTQFDRVYHQVMAEQVPIDFIEFYAPLAVWVEVHAYPSKDGISVYFQDVTARQQAEDNLRDREQFLRSIYEGIETAVFVVDVLDHGEFRYVGINPTHERLTGMTDAELRGKTPQEVLPPAAARAVTDYYRMCVEARARISYEECLPLKGQDTWWITNLTPLFDRHNRVYRLIGTSFNINDRKETEIALQQQLKREQLLKSIQERIRSSLQLDEILAIAAEEIRSFLGCDRILIYEVLPEDRRSLLTESVALGCGAIVARKDYQDSIFSRWKERGKLGSIVKIDDIETADLEPEYVEFLKRFDVKAKLVIPILKDQKNWGLIVAHSCKKARKWHNYEIESLNQLAVQLAIAVQQSMLFEQAQAEIAERKKAEAALRESQDFVRRIADTSPNLLYIFDAIEQCNIYTNREIATTLGYSSEEIKAMGNNLLPSILHPDDLSKIPEHFKQLDRAPNDEILELEYRMRNARGEWRHILAREAVFARTQEGKLKQLIGTASDITERKKTEAALRESAERERALAAAIRRIRQSLNLETIFVTTTEELRVCLDCDCVAIYRFDEDYRGQFMAESVAKPKFSTLGKPKEQQLQVVDEESNHCGLENLLNSPHLWEEDPYYSTDTNRLELSETTCLVVEDVYAKNFSDCYRERLESFQIRAYLIVPIFCNSRVWGLLAAYQCSGPREWKTSDRKMVIQIGNQLGVALQQFELLNRTQKQSEALAQAAIAADAANRSKSEFLANMSHELRTPLNAILGFAQIMTADDSLNSEHRRNLNIINRAGAHLLDLINDVLEMSKIEAGRIQLNENDFDLLLLLDTLQEILKVKADSKGLDLIFERSPDVPQFICGDEGKLRQVLLNLIGNAIKFTHTGSVTLCVTLNNKATETGSGDRDSLFDCNLLFSVEDTGEGIAPEEMGKLFEAFGQTESGQKSQQGTGLGLPISQKFVELMGGSIEVWSQRNVGSVFSFNILAKASSIENIDEKLAPKEALELAPHQPQIRILVVDDRDESRLLVHQMLAALGFTVREAINGLDAIEVWRDWQPDLVLMDIRMPVMDGLQATQTIKSQAAGEKPIIIALTASAFEEERSSILAAGCDDFIRKPFQRDNLLDKIREHLDIEYIYKAEDNKGTAGNIRSTAPEPSRKDDLNLLLAEMPEQWIRQIYENAARCIDDKIIELLEEVPDNAAYLAEVLGDWANNFQFQKIMEFIDREKPGS